MSGYLVAFGLLVLAGVIFYIYLRVRRTLISLFGTANLVRLAAQREEEAQNTPRSLAGATDLVLPRLAKDFPEANWPELQAMGEKALLQRLRQEQREGIRLHRSVLCDYRNQNGLCQVIMRSAVEYLVDKKRFQARYAITIAYVQDADAFGYEKGISFTCPSCGAPIKALGEKKCAYCGSAVEPVVSRTWRVESIREE